MTESLPWKLAFSIVSLCCLGLIFGLQDGRDAAVTSAIEAEVAARKAVRPCDITVRQFGPGEYGVKPYECARFAGEVPAHVMTMPVAEAR